jgi:hypothetical protein
MRRLILAAFVIACAACGGAGANTPQATLSTNAEAGHAMSELRDAFEHEPHEAPLAKRFVDFIAKYPKDVSTPLARLHLAHVLLDMKDVAGARRELAAVAEPPPGNAHDFWLAVKARLLRVDGKADEALAILSPLVGTTVDLPLRSILLEEVAVTSIDARRSLEAVGYLDGWLRAVPPHAHKAAHERVREQLGRIDAAVLEQTLDAMQGEGGGGYSAELQKLVAEALAKDALDKQDTRLAQKLIDGSLGKYLTGSTVGQDLRDLATSLRGAHVVVARTIGLVLPTDTPELRDEAADAARGAAFALGLPRAQTDDDGTRLVTRADATTSLDASLEELAGAGASVILAGFDEASAERACKWSEANGLAVITFAAPQTPGTKFCFVAGEARRTSIDLLVAELEKRGAAAKKRPKVVPVSGGVGETAMHVVSSSLDLMPLFKCEPPYSRSRMPLEDWEKAGVKDFLVSAPSGCVRTLLPALPRGADVGLALESSGDEDARTGSGLKAFVVAPSANMREDIAGATSLDEYKTKFGAKPSYWTALGHDGALIAHVAESELPNDRTTLSSEIGRRREQARKNLLSATTTLWTSEVSGFAQSHKLPRTLRVVDLR